MASRNIAPRANGEGSVGTSILKWLAGWFGTVNATTVNTGSVIATGNIGAATFTGDGSALTGIASGTGGVTNTGSTTIGADTDETGGGEIALQTRNLTRVTIANNGDVGVGLAPTVRNNTHLQTVDGIGFPATQVPSTDPNTLDDYEEGEWTPTLGGDATYSIRAGTYVKIGKKVTVWFYLTVDVLGTGSTTTISGLPFTPSQNSAGVIGYYGGLALARAIGGFFCSGATLRNYEITSATTRALDQAIFGNGTRIDDCTITYFV